jgi:hypothetical protein
MESTIQNYFIIFLFFLAIPLQGQEFVQLMPSAGELPGWKFNRQPQVLSGDELFDLIDGGADIYLEYGFGRVISAQYIDPSQNLIQAEIYEMADEEGAYGIFSISQSRTGWTNAYGTLSAVTTDYISFWKGKFYVILSWSSKQSADEPLLSNLARLISGKINSMDDFPEMVSALKNLTVGSNAVLIRGNLGLSNFYYFDYKDLFEISEGLASSNPGYHQIILRYSDTAKSIEVMQSARQSISANKRFSDITAAFQGFSCRDNKGNLVLTRQTGPYIIILVGLEEGRTLVAEMDVISREIENLKR